ncbi:MAG: alpha/beta hydrolase [Gemmataceae bacterium]|nr:alpha/beta hydrolase [Gemmataceae bacterium]
MFEWVRLLLIGYLGIMLLLMLLENWLVYPASRDSQPPPCREVEDVHLTCANGTNVHGWWLPCADSKLALLYFHGNGGNLSWRGPSIMRWRDRLGVAVLIVDYPGYGRSEGRPSEQGCYETADAAYEWLVQERKVAPKNLLIYGGSLGGGVAVDLASRREHRALILARTFTSAPDVASGAFFWLPVRWMMRNRFASIDKIGRCAAPIFMSHGDRDEVVPFSLGKKLFEAAPEPKRFHVMPGVRHNDPLAESMYAALKTFLAEHAPVE